MSDAAACGRVPAAHAPPAGARMRAPVPPFTEEHEQFREVVRRFLPPH